MNSDELFPAMIFGFVIGAVLFGTVAWYLTSAEYQSGMNTPAKAWIIYVETKDDWNKRMNEAMGVK